MIIRHNGMILETIYRNRSSIRVFYNRNKVQLATCSHSDRDKSMKKMVVCIDKLVFVMPLGDGSCVTSASRGRPLGGFAQSGYVCKTISTFLSYFFRFFFFFFMGEEEGVTHINTSLLQ